MFRCDGKPVSLVILAGGESRRMKKSKALLPAPDRPLIERILTQVEGRFDEILISVSKGRTLPGLPQIQVEDEFPGRGPIEGVRCGVRAARHNAVAVIACDIPDIDIRFLARLIRAAEERDIAVPVTAAGDFEPLFAVYKKSVLPAVERLVATGNNSLIPLFSQCRTRTVPIKNPPWLKNLNTPEDYARFLRALKARGGAAKSGSNLQWFAKFRPGCKGRKTAGGPPARRPVPRRRPAREAD
jgi:molybdopterin-guanine dinucleotide biosynthesis protein A